MSNYQPQGEPQGPGFYTSASSGAGSTEPRPTANDATFQNQLTANAVTLDKIIAGLSVFNSRGTLDSVATKAAQDACLRIISQTFITKADCIAAGLGLDPNTANYLPAQINYTTALVKVRAMLLADYGIRK